MKLSGFALGLALLALTVSTHAAKGLVTIESPYSAEETLDRLQSVVESHELTVFARIDHAAGAARIGASLRPTALLIFGNPRGGTPFMQCAQSVAIDLPLKALVWEDADSRVWIGYNDPAYLAARHGVEDCRVVPNLQRALKSMTSEALAD
jgi:uncharacterized protein (DUF302 family)